MRTHGKPSTYRAGCRCDECRLCHNARMRAYFASRGGNPYRQPQEYEHTCSDCGIEWSSSTTRKDVRCRPCATARRRGSQKSRELVHVGPVGPPNFCPLPKRHPAMRVQKSRLRIVWFAGFCGHCGESFVDDQPKARFCSRRCGRAASKRRRGYFSPSPKVRSAIYERDNWTCQLCIESVEPSLPPSDPWAATLDHIRCQSWDEIPDHSPSNLRLAHRWCNSVRGDETYYTAAVLVA